MSFGNWQRTKPTYIEAFKKWLEKNPAEKAEVNELLEGSSLYADKAFDILDYNAPSIEWLFALSDGYEELEKEMLAQWLEEGNDPAVLEDEVVYQWRSMKMTENDNTYFFDLMEDFINDYGEEHISLVNPEHYYYYLDSEGCLQSTDEPCKLMDIPKLVAFIREQ